MGTRTAVALLIGLSIALAGCGDDDTGAPTSRAIPPAATTTTTIAVTTTTSATTAPTSTVPATTATIAPTTTITEPTPIETNDDGAVVIDWSALEGVFFAPPVSGAADPFFHVHNQPAADGFFLSVEAYTVYGTAWTGELGAFEIDCSAAGSGICVHFDPDGPGPIGDLGADFLVTGSIEIVQADAEGFRAVVSNVTFTDGTTIPGPLAITS